jgi:glycine reductase
MRVVHYLNQFFGGIGSEEEAGIPPQVRSGAVGPGRALEQALLEGSRVVSTLLCGDNYAAEHPAEIAAWAVATVRDAGADLLVAGPCFQAGRYGTAAGAVCNAVQDQLGVPAVAGMAGENPGVDIYRGEIYIIDSGRDVAKMQDVLVKMATLGIKLATGRPVGRPAEEGYLPQGKLRSEFVDETAAQRLADMLLAKLRGQPFESEAPVQASEPVPVPLPVADLSKATIAVVTDGGLVPKGNPDQIPTGFAKVWGAYSFAHRDHLRGEDYEVTHGGYDVRHVQADPNRLVPVDVLREMERDGLVGKLHDEFLSTTGNLNPLENSRRLGREMVEWLKIEHVDGVILVST